MSALDRKLFRDLRQIPGQLLAISLVMACGVAVLIMSVGTHRFLDHSRDTYYERNRFGNIFAVAKRVPRTVGERLREIPGVGAVDLRIMNDVVLDVAGLDEPVVGRLISLPLNRIPPLNRLYLRRGRRPNPLQPGEVLASEGFVKANKLALGDSVQAVINGRHQELRIVGVALSPEYIFQIRPGSILPDEQRFGIFWMGEQQLEAAFNMEGAFNSVSLSLMHGASEEQVIEAVDRILKPYGCTGAYGRDRQVSARFVDDEIKQLRAMAFVAPSIFFAVGCFLLNVVLARLIATQREQIAALKAFGYHNYEVGTHFLKFVLVIALVGCSIGAFGGEFLARSMATMYAEFYRFPALKYETDWPVNIAAVALTVIASTLATLRPVWRAVSLPPAEAMRPEPPAKFRRTLMETLGIGRLLTASGRMTFRELERRPLKSLMSALGIACAVAVLVLGNFGVDAIDYLIRFQFVLAQRFDVAVTFIEPTSEGAVHELAHLPGVMTVESYRAVPVRFRSRHITHLGAITGLEDRRDLNRVLDSNERPLKLPPKGLMLGDKLAEILQVQAGDLLHVDNLEQDDVQLTIPVSGIFKEYAGTNAYMSRDALHELLQEGPCLSGAYLLVDSNKLEVLYAELKETPRVAGVAVQKATIDSFNETIAENQLRMQSVNLMFACIIAFGVVYNTARISLAERSREFATLRVIGFTRGEVSRVILFELGILTLLAIPLGYAIGYGFCSAMVKGFESEMFRIPVVISTRTMGLAAGVTIAAAFFSGLT
ncbi:MAG: FtsX-like permease family protein, partial [Planctomycetaceae bacterium]|nr:FtsX-like permease family protein [Planctomycetaceae bacterium]